ncbi:MarR family transcriptional regulator [Aliifodinibius sp. S!AR15-10]|nr:MarR family transcriptional regulator [Aliifodinibius sp. S!AR15-10]
MAEEAFRSLGLAPSYAYLLMTVNDQPGIQPSAISRELGLSPSTVTRLIEKMEYRGFLERVSEGRATKVMPTEECKALNPQLEKSWQNLQQRFSQELGERYKEVLTEMSYKAAEKLE